MVVYTFWEPSTKIPYYLQLCLETWKKNLPNTTIVVLDYKNMDKYIDVNELGSKLLSGKFTLPQISDAIRVALLAKNGGVWLDLDTIILSSEVEKYFLPDEDKKTIVFRNLVNDFVQMCFINSPPDTKLMNTWLAYIREKIQIKKPHGRAKWYFFGNGFINDYAKEYPDEIKSIDHNIAMPHRVLKKANQKTANSAYLKYYFGQNLHLADISNEMLFLQNSWTPQGFKNLSPEDMLRCDCTMTNVLAEALGISLPPDRIRYNEMFKQ